MSVKSVVPFLVVVLIVFFIVTSPDKAASITHTGWKACVNIAHGMGDFIDKL